MGTSPKGFTATRIIEIDAGHRVPAHDSKCKNLHGHRYRVEATFFSEQLTSHGSEHGMVKDFGVIKDLLNVVIDTFCDHGLILWVDDPLLVNVLGEELTADVRAHYTEKKELHAWGSENDRIALLAWRELKSSLFGKVCVVGGVPTAEFLAAHWFHKIVAYMNIGNTFEGVELQRVRVYETPNCWADYPA